MLGKDPKRNIGEKNTPRPANDDRYHQLIDQIFSGYALHEIICDDSGVPVNYRFLEINHAFEKLTGLKAENIIGKTVLDVLPSTESSWIEKYGKVALTGETIRFENYTESFDSYYEVTTFSPQRNQFACVFNDITDRKKLELESRKNAEKLRNYIDHAPDGVFVVDENGHYLEVNEAAIKITGYSEAELLSMSIPDLFPPEGMEIGVAHFGKVKEEGEAGGELLFLHKNGEKRWWAVNAIKLSDTRYLEFAKDITERKHSSQLSEENEAKYRALFEKNGNAIFIYDLTTMAILDVNTSMTEIYGYSYNELIGMNCLDLSAEREKSVQASDAVNEQGRFSVKYRYHKKQDGTVFPLEKDLYTIVLNGKKVGCSVIRDISERVQTEEALRNSENLFKTTFYTSPDSVNINRLEDGLYIDINEGFTHLTGYTREDVVGKTSAEINIWQDMADRERLVKGLKESGHYSNLEAKFRRKDGLMITALMSASIIQIEKVPHILSITRDITQRKGMEEALRESEIRFKALHNASFGGIAIHDKGVILECNQGLSDMFGYSMSELLGMDGLLFVAEDSRDYVMRHIISGNEKSYEANGVRKDGKEFPMRLEARNIPYKGKNVRVVEFRDITEQKEAELALSVEKENLAVTLRSIGDGVITTDIDGNIVMLNKVAETLTGWETDEAEGKPLFEVFNIINELTREICENPVEKVIATGQIVELANHTCLISRTGKETVIADSGAPIHDKDSRIIGVVLVFRDMTEKQKLDDFIQKSQKLESLGVLAGGIAHDFNNLLSGIFGYLEMAMEKSSDAKVIKYLSASLTNMDRARAFTRQLITFAKGGAPIKESAPLFPFIKEAVQFALSGSSVSGRFEIDSELRDANFDKNQIAQVIDNLTINAVQAMPSGGVIDVSVRNCTFGQNEHISLSPGDYVEISIKDQGVGIPKEFQGSVFDPYYTTKSTGHGLGLSSCYSIVTRHDGFMDFESNPGQGSIFRFYLPASTASATAVNGEILVEHRGSGTFLVMDDEESLRELLKIMLESFGYTVVLSKTGEEAIEFFKKEMQAGRKLAGMIFDLTIPGAMGGKEAVAEIRKISGDVPIFVASGYSADPIMANPQEYGFSASICKPFRKSDFSGMLENYLK